MSSGLYDTSKKDFDKTLDLHKLMAYGDTMNDGKVQLSFTLPVKNDDRGAEAARQLARAMGITEPNVALGQTLDKEFTFMLSTAHVHTASIMKTSMSRALKRKPWIWRRSTNIYARTSGARS